jgi:hypothetical protein
MTIATATPPPWRRRVDVALRIVAALPGGYAVASLWAMALARILPGDRGEATIWATIVAFALCALIAMWAFAARSGWRALWSVVTAGAIAAGIVALSIHFGGRI